MNCECWFCNAMATVARDAWPTHPILRKPIKKKSKLEKHK